MEEKLDIDLLINELGAARKKPVHFLVGTDWWTDCDDVVAMGILCWAQKKHIIQMEAIGINACMEYSVASLDSFLKSEGVTNLPIGIDLEATDFGGSPPYQKNMVRDLEHYLNNSDCEDAVSMYRKILATSKEKLDIIEIGYPQVLANVLKSKGDDISPLCGCDLIQNKVNKLWMMAGNWENLEEGFENNFARNARSREAGHSICDHWPTPITFLGWEVSNMILTGGNLLSQEDMIYRALCDHGSSSGRSSWDPMLVLLACIQEEEKAGYTTVRGKASVDPVTGKNHFEVNAHGKHCFVRKSMPDEYYKEMINTILEDRVFERLFKL